MRNTNKNIGFDVVQIRLTCGLCVVRVKKNKLNLKNRETESSSIQPATSILARSKTSVTHKVIGGKESQGGEKPTPRRYQPAPYEKPIGRRNRGGAAKQVLKDVLLL